MATITLKELILPVTDHLYAIKIEVMQLIPGRDFRIGKKIDDLVEMLNIAKHHPQCADKYGQLVNACPENLRRILKKYGHDIEAVTAPINHTAEPQKPSKPVRMYRGQIVRD